MKKIFLFLLLVLIIKIPAQAFQDCLLLSDGKLTDIQIEHNDIIDVFPVVTVMNERNTLFVQPLKVGQTKFSILKNKKTKYIFDVNVTKEKTTISNVDGFDSFILDLPSNNEEINVYDMLDLPPGVSE